MKKEIVIKGKKIGEGKPVICVPVTETRKDKILKEVSLLVGKGTEMIEWRVDFFEACEDLNAVREVLESLKMVLVHTIFLFTFRTKKQGGNREIEEEKLVDLYEVAAESECVDLIDLEFFELNRPIQEIRHLQKKGVKIIASHHDFDETPQIEVMDMLIQRMAMGGADIVKLAVMPNDIQDVLNLLQITNQFHQMKESIPIITMSMGKMGMVSRLCGETFGSCVTFGAREKTSAPGQMQMDELEQVLRIIHESGKEHGRE